MYINIILLIIRYGDRVQFGRVDNEVVKSEMPPPTSGRSFMMVCGTKSFTSDMTSHLIQIGYSQDMIHVFWELHHMMSCDCSLCGIKQKTEMRHQWIVIRILWNLSNRRDFHHKTIHICIHYKSLMRPLMILFNQGCSWTLTVWVHNHIECVYLYTKYKLKFLHKIGPSIHIIL